MKFFKLLKKYLRICLLRGPFFGFWLKCKVQKLERIYLTALVENSRLGKPRQSPFLALGSSVKRVLLISDVQWENRHLVPELGKICPVDVLDLNSSLKGVADKSELSERVVSGVNEFCKNERIADPSIILFYARPELLSDEVFDVIRKRWRSPILGLNLDDKIEFLDHRVFSARNDNYQRWAKCFDLNLTSVRAVYDWYVDHNLPSYYMPAGYHPMFSGPLLDATFHRDLSFVGSWRPEREKMVNSLRRHGVWIDVFGSGWPDGRRCNDPERVYRESQLNLGLGFASPSEKITSLKARDFECPGSGACYLTTYNWELALHFEIGKEILCYRSVEELIELISFYRRRPDECIKISVAAYNRCLREHTWEKRFRKLFAETGM